MKSRQKVDIVQIIARNTKFSAYTLHCNFLNFNVPCSLRVLNKLNYFQLVLGYPLHGER